MSIERVRRVVTGEPESLKAVFSHVEEVESLPDVWAWLVWGWDEKPTLPHHPTEPYVPRSWFPPRDGMRIIALRMGAAKSEGRASVAGLLAAEPAGLVSAPDRPSMHRSDSIDIAVVVSGEVTVEAPDGSSVTLGPGDVYVQNGAMHQWHFNPDDPAHVVFVILGAERVPGSDPAPSV